ncbi:cytochrome P450 [Aspergillus neoniger CBS 115656]|uniref:Cytochrome P450 n=1 Tax=Aspergillus neoniger (strain CBS 115656) TaxID=1448310 RepID=A0A318YDE0_ASPNB|nr:cytochrome P450 [Aspergillus neoniger CBS 115656]PYH32034.1 cytochrome P450 [Aspergillus neoniger CBS 115656]
MTSTPYMLQPVSNICSAILDKQFRHSIGNSHLPAGPSPLPIIGNVHQMLTQRPIEVVHKWHQKYGTMVAFRYGQQLAISIGSFDIAQELLTKRGAIYSSRPQFAIATRMTRGVNSAIMPYGKEWQNQHRIMSSLLDSTAVSRYYLLENMESKQAICELLGSHDFGAFICRYAGSIVMTLGYGIRLETTDNDIPAQLLAVNNHPFDAIGNSYYRVVELFPRFSDNVERETTKFHMKHFEIGKSASTWNWVQNALKTKAGSQIASTELAYVIGTLQKAGFEVILTVLRLIIKAIVLYPQCLKEAQRELDRVAGSDRLPSSEDIPQLRYVNAILNEAMRWQPPTPFAIPHATTQDDEYMGYQIPRGTVFPDPHKFKPERWIENPDLEHSPFGFGRRICPGRHLGWNSVFILMARLMWAYNITHSYKDGKRIEIDPWDIKLTFTAASKPFKASFEVREPKKQEIIEREWENATKDPVQIMEEIGRKTEVRG